MGRMTGHTAISNRDIAAMIGMSHSGVSRLRTGNRGPSLAIMRNIEQMFGWPVQSQSEAHKRGLLVYAKEFNDAIERYERGFAG